MKNNYLFGTVLSVLAGMALPSASTSVLAAEGSAEVASGRLPADLARADRGTKLDARGAGSEAAQVLIGKDASAPYSLAAGTTSMLLTLPKIEIVNHFDFITGGAEGSVTVSVSSTKLPFDSADWREVVGAQAFAGKQLIPCDLGSVEARYVKVDFNAASAGKISGFNLFGASVAPAAVSKGEFRVSAATSDKGNVEGAVSFDAAHPAPKVVADLGEGRTLNKLTCSYKAPAGVLDFFLVDDGTAEGSARVGLNYVGEPSLQPASNGAATSGNVLAGKQPIYSVDTAAKADGTVVAELGKLNGRYLVAAFRPTKRQRSADGKDSYAEAKDYSTGKDAKEAPVFPAFTQNPAGFGNPPTDSGTPLVPPAGGVVVTSP